MLKGKVIRVCRAFYEIYQDCRNEGKISACVGLYLEGDLIREKAIKRTGLIEEEFDRKATVIRKRMLS